MSRRKQAYFLRVARSLGACQLVEFELKLYITQALELVEKCVADRMPFKMAGRDYQDASLERLIEAFKKLSDCPALVKRLASFKDERNFVAHKAIAACIDPDGELGHGAAKKLESRLENIEKEAVLLTEAIHAESLIFVAHLYFDVIEKADKALKPTRAGGLSAAEQPRRPAVRVVHLGR